MKLRNRTLAVAAALLAACGGGSTSGTSTTTGTAGGTSTGTGGNGEGGSLFSPDSGVTCHDLGCQIADCEGGKKTKLSGTVYSPKGDVPLYNVLVYVPNAPLDPLAEGASCDRCGAALSGEPIVTALTDTKGHFVLENVPTGTNIPLVIQVGKWRREVTIPKVDSCVDNAVDDHDLLRLPRNKLEGHIPRIALTTGGADALECLLRKIGIDDTEFTPENGKGRVNLFAGSGGANKYAVLNGGVPFTPAQNIWSDVSTLQPYDVVLLACEAGQHSETKPPAALSAMYHYTSQGGRVFASHWHNYWLEKGPDPYPQVATFNHQPDLADPFEALIDTTFPKGYALGQWLLNVGGTTDPTKMVIHAAQHTVDAVNPTLSRQWIYSTSPKSVQYLTFNTPADLPDDQQCGRIIFSDIHVSSADKVGADFPTGCTTTTMSAQEKALLFMLFDLSACVQDDGTAPTPPQ